MNNGWKKVEVVDESENVTKTGITVKQEDIPEGCEVHITKGKVSIEFRGNWYFAKSESDYNKTMQAIHLLAEI